MESLLRSIGRYTRFVYSAKLTLVVLAAILTALVLFYPIFRRETGMHIAFTSIMHKGPGSPTVMIGPKFYNIDKNNQPYEINAKTATKLDDNTMELDHVSGDIALSGGAWFAVSSNSGLFKVKENTLGLKGSVEMFNDGGYEFRTEQLQVDVGKKTAVTRLEVQGQGPLGTLKAYGGAEVDSIAQVVTFGGPVFVTVYPSQGMGAAQTQKAGQ